MQPDSPTTAKKFLPVPMIITAVLICGILWWFYYHVRGFGGNRAASIFGWLTHHWRQDEMEHAWLVPVLCAVMIGHVRHRIREASKKIDWRGMLLVLFGAACYVIGYRVIQARICVAALPIILLGCVWYLAGLKTAKICAIPILFLWMMVPLILVQQATVGLQVMATQLGNWGANLFGVDTYVRGTAIFSLNETWDAYTVSGGCSGMRSLMALVMISIVWAFLADLSVWKKLVLVASSIPLAIIGNAFRIASIVTLAEYVDPSFASKTWHDWSGLLLFFPCTLLGLMLVHSLLAGELIWFGKKRRRVVIRSNSGDGPQEPPAPTTDTPD